MTYQFRSIHFQIEWFETVELFIWNVEGVSEAFAPSSTSMPSTRSISRRREISSLSSRMSLALASSLTTALHIICLARSAYLDQSTQYRLPNRCDGYNIILTWGWKVSLRNWYQPGWWQRSWPSSNCRPGFLAAATSAQSHGRECDRLSSSSSSPAHQERC